MIIIENRQTGQEFNLGIHPVSIRHEARTRLLQGPGCFLEWFRDRDGLAVDVRRVDDRAVMGTWHVVQRRIDAEV